MGRRDEEGPGSGAAAGMPLGAGDDAVVVALQDLAAAADRIAAIAVLAREHLPRIRDGRSQALTYREILAAAPQPLIGAVLTDAVAAFEAAGSRYRRVHGRVLQQEGMTLREIAALWGLTRQRISELLQGAEGRGARRRPPPSAGAAAGPGAPPVP